MTKCIIYTLENRAQMCHELLNEILDKVFVQEESARKGKYKEDATEDN